MYIHYHFGSNNVLNINTDWDFTLRTYQQSRVQLRHAES